MTPQVITGPLAIVKANNKPVGKMKNIRVSESMQRARVTGLGQLIADEMPVTSWSGTISCSWYNIDFRKSMMPDAILREVQTQEEFATTLLLQEDGVQVDVLKRVKDFKKANGVIVAKTVIYCSIPNVFINQENFDISEGQVSSRDGNFDYLGPIIFPA